MLAVLTGGLGQPLLPLRPWGQPPEIAGKPMTQLSIDKLRGLLCSAVNFGTSRVGVCALQA